MKNIHHLVVYKRYTSKACKKNEKLELTRCNNLLIVTITWNVVLQLENLGLLRSAFGQNSIL